VNTDEQCPSIAYGLNIQELQSIIGYLKRSQYIDIQQLPEIKQI
jgi:hypothetical protein